MLKFLVITLVSSVAFGMSSVQAQEIRKALVTTTPAITSAPVLPSNLSGRWYRHDSLVSQVVNLKQIDVKAGTGVFTWYSANWAPGCTMVDVPAVVKYDGSTLEITVASEHVNALCIEQFYAKLERQPDGSFKGTTPSMKHQINLILRPS